jgi:DNA-directed RNA polymerase specialized sigma24 family protein
MSKRRNKRSPIGAGGRDGSRAERRVRDEQAVSRVRLGDESAWRGLVENWLDFAFDRVTRRGVNARDAAGVLISAFGQVRDQLDDGADTSFAARVAQATSGTGDRAIGAITTTPPSDPKRAAGRITRGTDAAALARDPDVAALLWETAAVLGTPTAEVLDLHWRGGLDATEIAAATGTDVGAVEDRLAKLPTGYAAALRTRLLWLGGTPAHDQLADELRAESATSFDPAASRLIHRHIRA